MKRGNLYQNLRIEGQLKFKKLYYSNYMMRYRPPQHQKLKKIDFIGLILVCKYKKWRKPE